MPSNLQIIKEKVLGFMPTILEGLGYDLSYIEGAVWLIREKGNQDVLFKYEQTKPLHLQSPETLQALADILK